MCLYVGTSSPQPQSSRQRSYYNNIAHFGIAVPYGICLRSYCGAPRTSDQQQDWNSASLFRLNRCIIFDFTPTGLYMPSCRPSILVSLLPSPVPTYLTKL